MESAIASDMHCILECEYCYKKFQVKRSAGRRPQFCSRGCRSRSKLSEHCSNECLEATRKAWEGEYKRFRSAYIDQVDPDILLEAYGQTRYLRYIRMIEPDVRKRVREERSKYTMKNIRKLAAKTAPIGRW